MRTRGTPSPWRISASSRRRNSALLCVERVELAGQPGLGFGQLVDHVVGGQRPPLGDHLLADQQRASPQHDPSTVRDGGQQVTASGAVGLVDHRDAGIDEELGPAVGEPAGDHLRAVHDGGDSGLDQRLGGRTVEVDLVEDGDVSAADPRREARWYDDRYERCRPRRRRPGDVS